MIDMNDEPPEFVFTEFREETTESQTYKDLVSLLYFLEYTFFQQ